MSSTQRHKFYLSSFILLLAAANTQCHAQFGARNAYFGGHPKTTKKQSVSPPKELNIAAAKNAPRVAPMNNAQFGARNAYFGGHPKTTKKQSVSPPKELNIAAAKNAPRVAPMNKPNKIHRKIEIALNKPTKIEFNETPLSDAIEYFEDLHKINISIDTQALAEEGIEVNDEIVMTITAKEMKFSSALNSILNPFELTYHVKDESLVITTKVIASEILTTVVYDIRKLTIAGIPPQDLTDTLQVSIESMWLDFDGEGGSIKYLPGCLVVKQTYHAHKDIYDLLQQLERTIDRTLPILEKNPSVKTTLTP